MGLVLLAAPWTALWDTNYLLNPHPMLRSVALSPFARGAVSGLGLINVLLAAQEAMRHLAGPGNR